MLRDLLSSRWLQGGLVFFLLCVGGSLLYSWHVHRTTTAEFGKRPQPVSSIENKQTTSTAPVDFQTEDVVNTPDETTDTQKSEASEVLRNDTDDIADAFEPDDFVAEEEAPAEDVAVSPYGFGPYPELPEGWPADQIWPCISADHELMARVMVKLAHQGTITMGSIMENGLVYPTYPGAVYITWAYKEKNGALYIADISGDEDAVDRISAIEETSGETFKKADIPSDIKVLSFEKDGIDPYTFLNLQ